MGSGKRPPRLLEPGCFSFFCHDESFWIASVASVLTAAPLPDSGGLYFLLNTSHARFHVHAGAMRSPRKRDASGRVFLTGSSQAPLSSVTMGRPRVGGVSAAHRKPA